MIIGAFLIMAASVPPSFDCSLAKTAVERSICMDPALALRDKAVALLYTSAGKEFAFPAGYVRRQRQWLSRRDRCKTSECIRRAYDKRIEMLAGDAPSGERFQHSNYLASLYLTPIAQDWQVFWLGIAVQARKGQPRIVDLTGLVRVIDGTGRWVSDDGCLLELRKKSSAWRVGQGASCKRALERQCIGGTYYNAEDSLNPKTVDEPASCGNAGLLGS